MWDTKLSLYKQKIKILTNNVLKDPGRVELSRA